MAAWVVRHGEHGETERQALESGRAIPGWDEPDLMGAQDKEAMKAVIRQCFPNRTERQLGSAVHNLWSFVREIQRGDIVVMPRKLTPGTAAIGEVLGEYQYQADDVSQTGDERPHNGHFRAVAWADKGVQRDSLPSDLRAALNGRLSVFKLRSGDAEKQLRARAGLDPKPNRWDRFICRAQSYIDTGKLEEEEINYKVEIAQKLSAARRAVLAGVDGWQERVMEAQQNKGGQHGAGNLLNWRMLPIFESWLNESPEDGLLAMQAIWTEDDVTLGQRIRDFCHFIHSSAISSGGGGRARLAAAFIMGLDVEQNPPFMTTAFTKAYELTNYAQPERDADEAALYEHALGFLDRFIDEAGQRGLTLRHRLDTQSVLWALVGDRDPRPSTVTPPPSPTDNLGALAQELFLPVEFLEEMRWLLEDKKQVIFQGPPGTGKTYVAQKLAQHLAGNDQHRVRLVQFHPSYAYEDFVQGFRPRASGDGQVGFDLRNGLLVQAAGEARQDPDSNHYLIIDEINRGNLAKVFGELYFLLEYRNYEMSLQYSDELFSLPENLYIIGTMNTADRSIALVDLALRRRFHFMEFLANKSPIKDVLGKWLEAKKPHMTWVADLVGHANARLTDEDAAIGPSYFMNDNLDEDMVRLIWEHNVRPYIAERLFGQRERLAEFDFEKLRRGRDELTDDDLAAGGDGQDDATD